jgi:hypothetical protein
MWEALLSAGASLLGSGKASDSAAQAAATQAAATREANQRLERQYQQTRTDLAPYRDAGTAASSRLAQLLGIGGGNVGARSYGDIRSSLVEQTPYRGPGPSAPRDFNAIGQEALMRGDMQGYIDAQNAMVAEANTAAGFSGYEGMIPQEAGVGGGFNAYNAEIDRLAQEQFQRQMMGQTEAQASPDYGSLMRDFTGADLMTEPGYQFGLQQGEQALSRGLARGGMLGSGAALKAAQRFGQDYAGTKFGEAFNRDSARKTQKYNFLAGPISTGQNAAAGTGNAGMSVAGQVAGNTTGMGNAMGASQIAQGNAWQGGLQNAVSGYQQNELLKRITEGNIGFGNEAWRRQGSGMPPGYGDQ